MALTVVLGGTGNNKGTASSITSGTALTRTTQIAVDDYIITVVAADTASGLGAYVRIAGTNNVDLTINEAVTATNSGNVVTRIGYAKITSMPTGTGTVTLSIQNAQTADAKSATFYVVRGQNLTSSFDTSSAGTGSGTSPSSGASGTLAQADELVIGGVGIEDNVEDIAGSWTTGSSNVSGNEQQAGTSGGGGASNIVVRSAAEIVSATTAQTAAITSIASADWAAAVATFKAAAAATATARLRSLLGVGL